MVILNDLQQYLGKEAGKDNLNLRKDNFMQDMLVALARVIVVNVG